MDLGQYLPSFNVSLSVREFIPLAGESPRLSGESRNPAELVRRLALIIGGFTALGSGFRRSDESRIYFFTNSEADAVADDEAISVSA